MLDLLAQAAPLWLLGSAIAAVEVAAARPPWRAVLAATAGLGLVASGALVAPELMRAPPHVAPLAGARGLRIIQINLGGAGLRQPEAATAWLASQHPDLIFVDDSDAAFRAALQRQGFRWTRGTAFTGIASRRPLAHSPVVFSTQDWRTMPDMARARLQTPEGPADLIAVHLKRPLPGDVPDFGRHTVLSLEDVSRRYDRRRLILAGDLNLTPWSFALRRLDHTLGLQRRDRADFTWPAKLLDAAWPAPVAPLDHLYAGPGWRTVQVSVGPPIGATHFPLIIDLAPTP